MSETEVAVIKVHLEGIRCDISELKDGHKKMTELIGRLVYIEDKFKANDESHKILWDRINKNTETAHAYLPIVEVVKGWQKNITKITVGAISLGIVEIVRIFLLLYKGMK